ncbi:restriction endonuclease subunit S, partial [uncultured Methanobrevibacter sp.]|uniref:restriction endonuclease subunit S n=1 Tax=uncultured Methanobrevibacter sp. TaxID=253161 RepID=UPI0025F88248
DLKIGLLGEKYKYYQDFKKYLMQQIFAQKLRFNFDDDWNKVNLGDISTIGKGFTPSTSNPNYWDGDINWLSIADMNQGKYITETSKKITDEGCKNKKIVEKDTLIMSFKLTIGRLGILKKDMFTNEAICNFKWKTSDILTEYMYYYLSSINILKYGSQAAKGITLNNDTLSTIPVLLPSIEEQEKIVDILSNMDTKIQFIETNIEDVKKFKKGLLQQMFV